MLRRHPAFKRRGGSRPTAVRAACGKDKSSALERHGSISAPWGASLNIWLAVPPPGRTKRSHQQARAGKRLTFVRERQAFAGKRLTLVREGQAFLRKRLTFVRERQAFAEKD
jgi:hypothetical protein